MPDTTPTPAPEPMGGAPDAYLPMDSDGTIYWQCAGPTEHDARMAMGRTRGYDGFEVVCLPLYRRIVPSTPTAPPSAAIESWRDALDDAVGALRYIEQNHGRLYGVGFDRVYAKHDALSRPAPPATGGRDAQWLLTEAKSGLENWGRHHDWCQYGATAPCNCGLQGLLDKLTAPAPAPGGRDAEHPALEALHEYFVATDYDDASEGVKAAGGRVLHYVRDLVSAAPAPAPAERANGDELAEKYHAAWQAGYSAGVEWASRQSSAPAVELTEEAREAENDSWLAPFAPALRRKLEDDAIRRRVAEVTDADGWVRGLGDAPVSANQLLNRLTALSTPPSAGRES